MTPNYAGVGMRGADLVYVEIEAGELVATHPLSAGRRYQARASRNVFLRDCWSYYRVVDHATI